VVERKARSDEKEGGKTIQLDLWLAGALTQLFPGRWSERAFDAHLTVVSTLLGGLYSKRSSVGGQPRNDGVPARVSQASEEIVRRDEHV
jgi:hypothetical protein